MKITVYWAEIKSMSDSPEKVFSSDNNDYYDNYDYD